VNGSFYAQDKKAPFSFTTTWNVPVAWTVTAVAYDSWGDQSTSDPITVDIVDDVAPAVSITSPPDGATFPAKSVVALSATATSQYSSVSYVQFYNGTTLLKKVTTSPYTYNWSKPAAGTYTLTAVATDAQGLQTTSAPVSVTVE
jgi:hypothetical protein